eukprot:g25364.t1
MTEPSVSSALHALIAARTAKAGVIGLGYVGLPLAMAFARAGFSVTGFDIDPTKIDFIGRRESYIEAVPSDVLAAECAAGRFTATCDFERLAQCDVIAICVPTPLTAHRDPDLSFVAQTAEAIARTLRPGQLVVLESTTYPGTTDQVVKPILEAAGLRSGGDFFLGYSPEREDPGNQQYRTATIPKVVAGDGEDAAALMTAFYGATVSAVVPVSTTATAEAVKLTENIFRAVNIALVNELKLVYDAMGIDVPTRFIELAGEINTAMPHHIVNRLAEALDVRCGKALSRSKVMLVGLAYKKNVPDIRESPSLRLMELIEKRGGSASYFDPYVPEIPQTREYMDLKGRQSVAWDEATIASFDAIVIATDHDCIDYETISRLSPLIVDTRNVFARRGLSSDAIVKA